MPRTGNERRDHRLLLVSVAASAGFAVVSSVWGLLSGSSMIVFDGLYSFLSIGLSLLAVLALRVSRRGPNEDYPWGREAWEPVVVIVKALALGVLCLYAAVGAVQDLLAGGREVAMGWALLYAVLATAAGIVVTLVLRQGGRSDLVRAEAAEWQGDTLLTVGVLAGFAIAEALVFSGRPDLAAYIDPAMVVAVSVAFLWVPVRLVTAALREILSMAPPAVMRDDLQARVEAVAESFGLDESFVRASKVGSRLDIEIDFVVGADSPVQAHRPRARGAARRRRVGDGERHREPGAPLAGHRAQLPLGGDAEARGRYADGGGADGPRPRAAVSQEARR